MRLGETQRGSKWGFDFHTTKITQENKTIKFKFFALNQFPNKYGNNGYTRGV